MDGETIFAILLGAALAVFSLVIAGYPVLRDAFFRPARRGDGDAYQHTGSQAESGGDDDEVGLEAIYDSIDTLELDYQLGNLPEAEYRRQLQAYRLEAAAVIKAQWERGDVAEADLLPGRSDASGPPPGAAASCPECDAPIPAAHHGPCPGCGASVRGDGGNPGDADDCGGDGGNFGDAGDGGGNGGTSWDAGDGRGDGGNSGDADDGRGDGGNPGDADDCGGDGGNPGDAGDGRGDGGSSGDAGDGRGDGGSSGDAGDGGGDGGNFGDAGDGGGNDGGPGAARQ